ncbi:MAG TPA: hydrogenase maturation protease [Steroidobacteraceae bacterium]|nr:hydrogenase maturation protease [Steroidobacteraceae bacterium]
MSRACIFGIGSPSGDDQAGWLTVDALLGLGVGAVKLDRPGANLIPLLEKADWVILVDATQGSGRAGDIRHFGRDDWAGHGGGLSSHGFGVLDALMLAQALGSLPPRLELYGIEIGSANPGGAPGGNVRAAALRLAQRIAASLEEAAA